MMSVVITFLSVCVLLIVASVYYYKCVRLKRVTALWLWIIRCSLCIAALCAFFQPMLSFKTVAMNEAGADVFIDVSKSMQLFHPNEIFKSCNALKNSVASRSPHNDALRFFCFGDSLRQCPEALENISFSDKRSTFPSEMDKRRTVVIISDANWSNPSIAPSLLENKNCYFLPMRDFSPKPFLNLDCISFRTPVVQDSVSLALFNVQGFAGTPSFLRVSVKHNNTPLLSRRLKVDRGYFSDTLSFRFPTAVPGRSLYTVEIKDSVDSLYCRQSLMGNVIPQVLTATLYSSTPTLDERFISLAMGKDDAWKFDTSDGVRSDVVFLLNWDGKAKRMMSLLKPTGMAVFIGCLPCSTKLFPIADSFTLVSPQSGDSLLARILEKKLPPPSAVVACGQSLSVRLRMLDCIIRKNRTSQSADNRFEADTLPFLFAGDLDNRAFLALTAKEAWSMEFLPLGMDWENENASLLQDVLSIVKDQLANKFNRAFFLYPDASQFSEYDSCSFSMVLPSEVEAFSSQTQKQCRCRIDFSIKQGERRILDTSFIPDISGFSNVPGFRCRPLQTGTYSYDAVLSYGETRRRWIDTFSVRNGDLEFSIQGQNTILLNQMGIPLDMSDSAAVSAIINGNPQQFPHATDTRFFQIKQSWPLLAIIAALFTLEWIIRRKNGLDA
jgi:hypothetical protein